MPSASCAPGWLRRSPRRHRRAGRATRRSASRRRCSRTWPCRRGTSAPSPGADPGHVPPPGACRARWPRAGASAPRSAPSRVARPAGSSYVPSGPGVSATLISSVFVSSGRTESLRSSTPSEPSTTNEPNAGMCQVAGGRTRPVSPRPTSAPSTVEDATRVSSGTCHAELCHAVERLVDRPLDVERQSTLPDRPREPVGDAAHRRARGRRRPGLRRASIEPRTE